MANRKPVRKSSNTGTNLKILTNLGLKKDLNTGNITIVKPVPIVHQARPSRKRK